LSDRSEAVVIDFNAKQPYRPKVQVIRSPAGERFSDPELRELDLALFTEMEIAAVNDTDVRPYLRVAECLAEEEKSRELAASH
jgi:hypothetical protein